jgi:CheY-like chemotaxis protein
MVIFLKSAKYQERVVPEHLSDKFIAMTTTTHKKKILVIDDDEKFIDVVFYMLVRLEINIEPLLAEDAAYGFQLAEQEKPDIILLDRQMPGIDGFALARLLKKNKSTQHIPLILISGGNLSPEELIASSQYGCCDFLKKPFEYHEFKASIQNTLELKGKTNHPASNGFGSISSPLYIGKLIESIPHPVVVFNRKGGYEMFNESFTSFLADLNKTTNSTVYDLFDVTETGNQKKSDLELFRNRSQFLESEISFPIKNLTERNKHFLVTKVGVPDESGNISRILCVLRDISNIRKQYIQSLELQRKELAFQNIKLLQMTDYSQNLLEDLTGLSKFMNKEGKAELQKLKSNYTFSAYENIWNELESQFELILQNFYKKLDIAHPNLTATERKLCSYLKLNMTTRQIGMLTFSNEKSVEMARYRLRQRMNLLNGDSLSSYLDKF